MNYFEYDDFFRDSDSFHNRLMQSISKEMEYLEEAIKSGKLKGNWEIRPIERPGMKGYVAQGTFRLSANPTNIPTTAIEKEREPLTDVFDEKEGVKIYIEMPGVDKGDIQLDISEGFLEVKAKKFYKRLTLKTTNLDSEKATATCKNGVLKINIPKIQTPKEDEKRTIKIE